VALFAGLFVIVLVFGLENRDRFTVWVATSEPLSDFVNGIPGCPAQRVSSCLGSRRSSSDLLSVRQERSIRQQTVDRARPLIRYRRVRTVGSQEARLTQADEVA
jgi:hypothetical protein